MTTDYEKMAADVVAAARDFVSRATAAIGKHVDALEHRATRNSEHVARIETRLAAVERKLQELGK
jgi:primosomal protein N''